MRSGDNQRADDRLRALTCRNDSGETAPGAGCYEVVGTVGGILIIGKPSTDNATCNIVFGGPQAIPADDFGVCFYPGSQPLVAQCDGFTSGDCGIASGSWELDSGQTGFFAIGQDDDDAPHPRVVKVL